MSLGNLIIVPLQMKEQYKNGGALNDKEYHKA